MSNAQRQVRAIEPRDVAAVVDLVHGLARYERASEECTLSEAELRVALFCERPMLFGHVAEVGGRVVGCALWFLNFSTWRGTHGIYVEDLFVQPGYRRSGLGRALMAELARECRRHGYGRLEWAVLDWNEPAVGFYRSLGAQAQDEWTTYRLAGTSLTRLAEG